MAVTQQYQTIVDALTALNTSIPQVVSTAVSNAEAAKDQDQTDGLAAIQQGITTLQATLATMQQTVAGQQSGSGS